ncbi:MAG: rhodanese-like domain-containing protein [Verrucomicrobiota bacterium]
MKSVAELGILVGVAVVAGLGNWLASGMPSASPAELDTGAPLKEGEILLADAPVVKTEGVVWIDARPTSEWRQDGLVGAINITMQSERALIEQVADHADKLLNAQRIIVYCSDLHCTASHDLAAKLKGELADFIGGEVLVLRGGVVSLRQGGWITSSSPDP